MNEDKIELLMNRRNVARRNNNYERADNIRGELNILGVTVMDTPNGSTFLKTESIKARQKNQKGERRFDGFLLTMRNRGEGFARRG